MHKITVDPTCSIIEVRLSGLLSVAEVRSYAAEVEPIIHRCTRNGGYRMVIDVSECAIQPQETVAAFQRHVAAMPQARRLAVVTGSSIVRMQIRRILHGPGMEMFTDRAEALAWLARTRVRGDQLT